MIFLSLYNFDLNIHQFISLFCFCWWFLTFNLLFNLFFVKGLCNKMDKSFHILGDLALFYCLVAEESIELSFDANHSLKSLFWYFSFPCHTFISFDQVLFEKLSISLWDWITWDWHPCLFQHYNSKYCLS